MAKVKGSLIAFCIIPALASILLFNLVQATDVSNAAVQEQADFQPPPLRALQWSASQIPYTPIRSRIAIVDSGVDVTMDVTGNLNRSVIAGWDAANNTNEFSDMNPEKHGTHVAGIICGNNYGLVPQASLLIVRSSKIDRDGKEYPDATAGADGIIWAVNNSAQIVICPWGAPPSENIAAAVAYAESKGVIIVAAVGNKPENRDELPDCWSSLRNSNILRVAAVQQGNLFASNSAYGQGTVEICAPGDGFLLVESTETNFVWTRVGTSGAAAFAGTVAAIVRDSAPWDEVIPRILNGADLVSSLTNKVWARGVINLERALRGESNPPLDTIRLKGKLKNKKKLSLSGTEVFLNQQTSRPILRIWVQGSLVGFVEPQLDGSFSFVTKGRFKSGNEVRVQSSLGGESIWNIP